MGRLALVTGATGFIGRHLIDRLVSNGWRVRALVRYSSDIRYLLDVGVECFYGDLSESGSIAAALDGVDTVFHLAAVTAARAEREYEGINIEGSRKVVDAIRASAPLPRRLVYLSSYAAIGPAKPSRPRSCHDEPAPLTAYGRTKLAGERVVREIEQDGVAVLVIRAPAVYGPGDRALLPYFRLVRARLAPVPSGNGILHLIYAPDLADALHRAADHAPGTFAIADPVERHWSDIVSTMARVLNRRPLRIPLPAAFVRLAAGTTEMAGRVVGRAVPFNREKAREMLAPAWICDLTGSEELLPPSRVTPLGAGLEETVRWYIRQGWL